MKVSRKAINATLPSITYIKRRFQYYGQTGIVPSHSSVIKHFIVYNDGGRLDSWYSSFGDAIPAKLYHGEYDGVEAVETVEQWMRGELTRAEVVAEIQAALLEVEA